MRKGQTQKCEDAVNYYDRHRQTWSTINFETQFETWPRSDLIKQIKMYEIEKQAQFQSFCPRKRQLCTYFMERIHVPKKNVLAQAFDEAFK